MKNKGEIPSFKNGKMPSALLYIIIIAITLAAIAVTIFLGKKNHRETIRLATEQFNRQQLILARSAAKGIEHFIADVDDDLLALSNFPVVQKMETGILDRMEVLYQGIPPQTSSRRLDKNGILRFIYPNEGWRKDLTGQDYSHETWFQKAKKTGEVVISGLIINEAGERRIRVVRPVYVKNEKGTREFNGVIKCSINPETMANLYISPMVSGDTGYAWLLNEQGIFMAHHEEGFAGMDAFKVRAETNPGLSYNTINNIQQRMMAGEEGAGRYVSGWHRGEKGKIEKLIAYTPVHVFEKLWSVAVCAPVDEVERITGKAYSNELYTVGFIIFILTAAGAFSFIAIYRRAQILEKEIEIRKQAQERIVHLNAVLQAVRNVNQLITKVKDRERLLQGACDNLIMARGCNSAWIILIEGDGGFKTAAQAGVGDGFPAMVDGLKRGELTHCMHQAVNQSGVLVVADPAVECGDCSLVGIYAGKARLIARLEHEGHIYGFITVTVSGGMAVDEEERSLFEEVAADIAFALHNMVLEEERKRAEEALRESKERFMALIESTSDWIWEVNENAVYTYASPKVKGLLGYEPEDIIGKTPFDLMTPEDTKRVAAEFGAIAEARKLFDRLENENLHKDGRILVIETSGVPIFDANGNFRGYHGIDRDITKRKQVQEERKKLEAQLSQAQKMEAIGTLAGGVAHDFNNLLTVIIGNAQLALMDVIKDESLRKGIEEVKKAGDKASFLTRQLLAFSRKQVIKPEVLDLNEEINETKKMFKRLIGEDIEFQTVLEPELWKVYADPGQINQVIMNLAVNARDAMYACADTVAGRPQGGKLTIETANTDLDGNYFRKHGIEGEKPGHYVMLALSDTGSGMDKEIQKHIFDPFFTTKEVGKGTGLGLSTVYGIVKQNNGFIWVYSEPGQGTTFKVYLPEAEGDADSEEKQRLPVIELDGSETVLIVEDDDGLRKFAQEVLLRHGYRVLDAENGEDALRVSQAHEGSIDLMITDVVMPKMGGKEAADRLQPFYPQMKVIYMSGYTDNAIVHHGVLAPGLNFLQKPFSAEGLARKVREALDR
jgi:PAS domain S-box-containing protein